MPEYNYDYINYLEVILHFSFPPDRFSLVRDDREVVGGCQWEGPVGEAGGI